MGFLHLCLVRRLVQWAPAKQRQMLTSQIRSHASSASGKTVRLLPHLPQNTLITMELLWQGQILMPGPVFRMLNMHHIGWPRSWKSTFKSRLRLYTGVNFGPATPRKWASNDADMPAGIYSDFIFYSTGITRKLKSHTSLETDLSRELSILYFSYLH